MEENSISIVNRTNGQLTGEHAQALPIKFVGCLSWVKIFFLGVGLTAVFFVFFLLTVKKQVAIVEVVGKANDYQILQLQ